MSKYFICVALFISSFQLCATPKVHVGILKYGTVNWEIDVIKHHQLDKKYDFELKVMSLASKNASAVALHSQAVDIILSDWLWVNRLRFEKKDYTLFPTSMATGGLYVAANSGINSLADLQEKKIGIAGGAVDKTWLLLQAYSQKKYGLDLKKSTETVFAVPPLLNRLMLRNDLDAAINFWHYGARLKAAGYKQLITVSQMLTELGIEAQIPLLGWVFDQQWANDNPKALTRFLQASLEAKQILATSDQEWQRIRPLIKADNNAIFTALKKDYRAGLLLQFGDKEIAATSQVFELLAKQGGSSLVGNATALSPGTFWQTSPLTNLVNAKASQ